MQEAIQVVHFDSTPPVTSTLRKYSALTQHHSTHMRGCATDTCNPYNPYHHQWMRNRKLLTFPARFPFPPTCGAAAAVRWSHWQLNKSMETGSTDSENSPPDATHQRRGGHLTVQRQWCARVEVGSNRAPPHAHSAPRPSVFFLRAIQSTNTR